MSKIGSNKILENCKVIDIADKGKSVAKSKSGEIVFLENAVRHHHGDPSSVHLGLLLAHLDSRLTARWPTRIIWMDII